MVLVGSVTTGVARVAAVLPALIEVDRCGVSCAIRNGTEIDGGRGALDCVGCFAMAAANI